jgi:hypothetical protein
VAHAQEEHLALRLEPGQQSQNNSSNPKQQSQQQQ